LGCPNVRRITAILLTAATLLAATESLASSSAERSAEAEALHRHALERLAVGTIDARRQALAELEQASLLDPRRLETLLDLGRLCLEIGQRQRGRSFYERAQRVAPDDLGAYLALGNAWTWEWLSSFDDTALAHARQNLARAAELSPDRADAWARLAALEVARGQLGRSAMAAARGCAADSQAWEPIIALACAKYRAGDLAGADSAFRAARGRMPEHLSRRFGDAISSWDGRDEQHDITVSDTDARARWEANDPDLTTPENEAELDYWTRLGLALLLFRDARGLRWDMRAELFVRYGPPRAVEINPDSSPLGYSYYRNYSENAGAYLPPPIFFPFNVQVWWYPELGIRAELWDRSLTQTFHLPISLESDADPRPDPGLIASRPDLVSLGEGRGVFRAMAPGLRPIEAQGHIARFPSADGATLVAHVVTAGGPTDTLRGAWAVVSSDGRVIARASAALTTSACDPTGHRVTDFAVDAPAGDYRVDLTVSGSGGRRGIVRLAASVPPPDTGLALSDLVMTCGPEGASLTPGAVRIEPDMDRHVLGSRPLTVYFEINGLSSGADGRARFAYTYSVTHEPDGRPRRRETPVAYEASREEMNDGARRRQLVTVPMRSIKSGTYDLRIEVRDLVAGATASSELHFVKE
jgi:tetratricopeptide (TPR) repeat protein